MEKKGSRVLAAVLAVVLAIGAAVGLTSIARATTATTVKSKYASETGDIQIGDGTAYKWIELTTNFEDGTSTKEKVFCADIFATFPAAEGDEVHHTDYKTKTEEFTGNDLVRAILYVGYENDKAGISQWIADDNYIGAPYTSLKYGTLWTASGADRVPDDQKDSFFYISTQAAIYRALHGNSGLNRLDYDDYYINCGAFQATRDYIYNTAQDYLDQGSIPADFKVEKHESVDGDHQVLIKAKTGTDSAEEKPAITNTTAKVGDKAATASEAAKPTIAEGADLVISDDVEFSNLADGKTYQIVSELWSNGSVQKTATQYVTSATQSPVTITFDAVRPANGQTFNIKTSLMLDGQEVAVHNSDRNLSNEQVVVTVEEPDSTGSLLIKKVDESGNKLAGAHLQLKKGDDVVKDLPNFSGEEGVYELEPGEYTLVEVEAPTRYETADPITVTVKKDTYQVNFATNAGGLGQFNVYQNGSVIGTAFCVNPNKDIPGTTPVDYKPMFDVDYDNIGITTSEGKNDARKLQVQRILTAFNDKADELKQMLGTASQPDAGLNLATAYAIETLLGGEPETPSTNFTTGDIMAVVDYLKGTIAVRGEIKYTFVYLKPNTTTSSQDVVVAVPYEGAITMTDLPKPSIVSTTAKAGGKNATSSAAAAPTVAAGETLVITDDVTLSNVTGEDYTVVADLWSNGSIQQTKEIAVPNGANSVTVTFDAVTPTNNQQFNVAAKLVKDGETVAEHNQNRQTVSERVIVTVEEQPEITNTTAKAGGKTATATDSAKPTVAKGQDLVISDVVEFAKLGDGEYTVEAELWSKGAVRQTKTATVTKADSSVEIAFDGVKPENGQEYNIVAKLKKGNDVVATHNSERNTVSERVNVTVESVKVKATKVWSDANNQDGIRPASVTIKLLADGTDTGRTVTLDESNEWKATFADLDEYSNGNRIAYTVAEDAPAGYTVAITGTAQRGFTVTNTHTPETTTVEGSKTWNDANDQDGRRPASITVRLHADGVEVANKTVTADDEWEWSFTNLPKYANGTEITYTITEDAVDDYTAEVNAYSVTNTYTPGRTSLTVEKVWSDANNQDGIRPASVTIKLLADGTDTGRTVTLDESNEWKATFADLDEYSNGNRIAYTVAEDAPAGYTVAITGTAQRGFTVTNTHTPEEPEIKTTATDKSDGDHVVENTQTTATIVDVIAYTNLIAGNEYTMTGQLHKKSDGSAFGEPVSKTFVAAEGGSGTVTIEFVLTEAQVSELRGDSAVAFEQASLGEEVVATHNNINDKNQTVDFPENPTVRISKTDMDGTEVEDAHIVVKQGNTVIDEWDSTSEPHSVTVDPGTYTLEETVEPAGFKRVETVIEFSVDSDGTVTVTTTNVVNGVVEVAEDGTLVLKDEPVDEPTPDNPTIGTTATDAADGDKVIDYTRVQVKDVVRYTGLVAGKEYTMAGTLVKKSDKSPVATQSKTFVAAEGGAGVVELIFEVDATALHGQQLVAFETCFDGTEVVVTHANINDEAQTVTVKEWPTVQIRKTDAATTEELDGAKLTLTDAEGNVIDSWTSDGTAHVVKVAPGTYTLIEDQAPLGYNTAESITFEVDENGVVGDPVEMKDAPYVEVTFTKKALGGDELEGATIQILDSEGNVVDEWVSATEPHKIKLPDGNYVMHEEAAPEGFYVATDIPFTVDSGDATATTSVNMDDKRWAEITISKTDAATTEELPGATLIIKKGETEIASWTSTTEPHKIRLEEGTYTLTEITAPEGYNVAETITFTVNKDGLVEGEKVEMVDQPYTEVTFTKSDLGGNEVVGAKIQILQDGQVIDEWTSTTEPHKISLPDGDYVMHEEVAPHGYFVATDIPFTVKAGSATNTTAVNMTDDAWPTVEISKTDAVTTEELPGAVLVVKDAEGNTIEQWISGIESHQIQLAPGEYTLTEITAPEGYEVAETITFVVNEKGLVVGDKVEMKDAPKKPSIGTNASLGTASENGQIINDVVSYTNLKPGQTYTLVGKLMDKATNKELDASLYTVEPKTFTPATANGTETMVFTLTTAGLEQFGGRDLVVFERLYAGTAELANDNDGVVVATHEDINSTEQTVRPNKPGEPDEEEPNNPDNPRHTTKLGKFDFIFNKNLDGKAATTAAQFSFELIGTGKAEGINFRASNDAEGHIIFKDLGLQLTQPGYYTFTLSEIIPADTSGISYDKTVYTLHVQVYRKSGQLYFEYWVTKADNTEVELKDYVFENTTEPEQPEGPTNPEKPTPTTPTNPTNPTTPNTAATSYNTATRTAAATSARTATAKTGDATNLALMGGLAAAGLLVLVAARKVRES